MSWASLFILFNTLERVASGPVASDLLFGYRQIHFNP
jgi:hypothetical protein